MSDPEIRAEFPDRERRRMHLEEQWNIAAGQEMAGLAIRTSLGGPGAPAWNLLETNPAAWANLLDKWRAQTRATARYEFKAAQKSGEIVMYGPIGEDFFGDGISARSFKAQLDGMGKVDEILLRVDSPGGQITDGQAIYNLLVQHPARVNVSIDGSALSAASFIAMAGDTISIAEGGFIMIHKARGVARGEDADMYRAGDVLKALTETIAQKYVARTGIGRKKIDDWMAAETWFDGRQAVEHGFADEIVPNKTKPSNRSLEYAEAFVNTPSRSTSNSTRVASIMDRIRSMTGED